MDIKDYAQMMRYLTRPRDVVPDPRPMDQEPRNMYGQGSSVDHAVRTVNPEQDSFKKLSNVLGAYRRYRRGEKNPKINFNQFFELYSTENFAEGGRTGYADKNAGTLVKKLIPLDKKKLDKANLKRATESVDDLYSTYTKEVIDNAAKEWAEMSNLEPNRTTPIKIQNLDEMENSNDRANFKRKFKEDIEKYGEWTPDRKSKQAQKRYSGVPKTSKSSFETTIFDAFGRKKLKGTDIDNPNYNLEKLNAMKKNLAEYKILKTYLADNFDIITDLDHPLDKATIQAFINSSSADLTNVNILERNLNTGFKKTLNNRYREAVQMGGEKGLKQKRAVEKIANQFNLKIGSVPDNQFKTGQVGPFEFNKIDKGVGSFETLNIKDEMLKSLRNASNIDTEWGKYIKDNPSVFEDARINIKKLKKPRNVENITKSLPKIEKYLNSTVTEFGSKSKKGKAAIQALAILAGSTVAAVSDDGSEGTGGMLKDAAIAGGAVGTVATKGGRKLLGNLFNAAGLPASLAFNYFAGIDADSSLDRTILGAELATAPSMIEAAVKTTDKIKNPILKKAAQFVTTINPKYAAKVARVAQPIGIATLGGELAYKVATESEPNILIDKETGDPKAFDRENAADVFPSMIDANEQAYALSKEKGISYEDAVKEIDYTRLNKLKND